LGEGRGKRGVGKGRENGKGVEGGEGKVNETGPSLAVEPSL